MAEQINKYIPIIEKIDKLRVEKGWSINYLAMEAGITQSTINNMYQRNSEPRICTLKALCKALNITLSEFFADDTSNSDIEEVQRRFNSLNDEQKQAVLVMLRSFK